MRLVNVLLSLVSVASFVAAQEDFFRFSSSESTIRSDNLVGAGTSTGEMWQGRPLDSFGATPVPQ